MADSVSMVIDKCAAANDWDVRLILLACLTSSLHKHTRSGSRPSVLPSLRPSIPPTGTRIQTAAKQMKELMDKKFSGPWQVAIGEGFGFDISHTQHNMVYIFYNSVGILCFKI